MQLLINIILNTSIYILVGFSFSFIYNTTKYFHLAHAAIISLGAYFVFMFSNEFSIPFPLAVIGAIILSVFIGLLCEIIIYRQMRKRDLPPLSFLIASLGIYVVLQNLISLYFGDDAKIISSKEINVGNLFLGAYITNIQIITIVASTIIFISSSLFLRLTLIGKSIRAVASNKELSNIYGINSDRIIFISFCIGSALAATAGILSALDTNMTPTFGFNLLLYGLVAMIIGGVGSTKGLIAGSLLVAASQHLAAYYIDTKWMDAITYAILILFLIWRPLGFSGNRLKKVEV